MYNANIPIHCISRQHPLDHMTRLQIALEDGPIQQLLPCQHQRDVGLLVLAKRCVSLWKCDSTSLSWAEVARYAHTGKGLVEYGVGEVISQGNFKRKSTFKSTVSTSVCSRVQFILYIAGTFMRAKC